MSVSEVAKVNDTALRFTFTGGKSDVVIDLPATAAPPSSSSTPRPIYIYASGAAVPGNFASGAPSARAAADSRCSNKPSALPSDYTNIRALISFNDTDSIFAMPTTYSFSKERPVKAVNNELVARDW